MEASKKYPCPAACASQWRQRTVNNTVAQRKENPRSTRTSRLTTKLSKETGQLNPPFLSQPVPSPDNFMTNSSCHDLESSGCACSTFLFAVLAHSLNTNCNAFRDSFISPPIKQRWFLSIQHPLALRLYKSHRSRNLDSIRSMSNRPQRSVGQ